MYSVVLMAAMTTAPATPDGLLFNRGEGGHHLFHRGGCSGGSGGGCSGYSGGCSGGYGGQVASGCGCGSRAVVPCSTCAGGYRYADAGATYSDGTSVAYGQNQGGVNVNTGPQQFAVPDGKGGFKIVTATGLYNGLPIIDANAQPALTNQVPVPQAMPNKQ